MVDFATEFANPLVIKDTCQEIERYKMALAYLYSRSPEDEDYEYLDEELESAWSALDRTCQSFRSFLFWYRANRPGTQYSNIFDKIANGEDLTQEERELFKNRPKSL